MVKDKLPTSDILWNKPDYHLLMQFICKRLVWREEYVREKIVVLLTQWVIRQQQLLHQTGIGVALKDNDLQPLRILKRRINNGVPILEIEWSGITGTYVMLGIYMCSTHDQCTCIWHVCTFSTLFHKLDVACLVATTVNC